MQITVTKEFSESWHMKVIYSDLTLFKAVIAIWLFLTGKSEL